MTDEIDPWLEREYNNRAKVADFAAIARGWVEAATAFRARWACSEIGIAYGPSGRQEMDIFWPGRGRDAPLALFIHGGYWQATNRCFYSHLAAGLLGNCVAVALPSYDLCPGVTLADIVAQMRRAAAFLRARHGREMLAIGHSAGGHLAACLLAEGLVPAALTLSGLFDLAPLIRTSINAALRLDAAEAARLSPALWPRPAGRIHAVVGSAEGQEYERQSRAVATAWDGTWESVPGADHFSLIAPLAEPGSELVRRAKAMLPEG